MRRSLQLITICVTIFSNLYCSNWEGKTEQQKEIQVSYAIDDKAVNISGCFGVVFVNEKDTLRGKATKSLLRLPDLKENVKYAIIFCCNTDTLKFEGVSGKTITPEQDIEWKFGIDNKPFNHLLGLLSESAYKSATKLTQLSYLQLDPKEFGDGIQFIVKE